jgi:hypothetical protein
MRQVYLMQTTLTNQADIAVLLVAFKNKRFVRIGDMQNRKWFGLVRQNDVNGVVLAKNEQKFPI